MPDKTRLGGNEARTIDVSVKNCQKLDRRRVGLTSRTALARHHDSAIFEANSPTLFEIAPSLAE